MYSHTHTLACVNPAQIMQNKLKRRRREKSTTPLFVVAGGASVMRTNYLPTGLDGFYIHKPILCTMDYYYYYCPERRRISALCAPVGGWNH